ncbi:MAG: hypothetical protein U1E76_10775 [Planctomycetota bacterium]
MIDIHETRALLAKLTAKERVVLASSASALLGTMLRWFVVRVNAVEIAGGGTWHGRLAMLVLLVVLAALLYPLFNETSPARRATALKIQLFGSALAAALALRFWVTATAEVNQVVSIGTGAGALITFLGAALACIAALLTARERGVPDRTLVRIAASWPVDDDRCPVTTPRPHESSLQPQGGCQRTGSPPWRRFSLACLLSSKLGN